MRNGTDSAELLEIAGRAVCFRKEGRRAALVTILGVSGSSFRRPGARALLEFGSNKAGSPGTKAGSPGTGGSGIQEDALAVGCLRGEIRRLALEALREGISRRIVLDLKTDDPVLGYSLMCPGTVDVLVEPLNDPLVQFLSQIAGVLEIGRAVVAAVFVPPPASTQGSGTPLERQPAGGRLVLEDGDNGAGERGAWTGFPPPGRPGAGVLKDRVLRDASGCLLNKACLLKNYGDSEIFFSPIEPPPRLLILGADGDAVCLAELARGFGFKVTVADPRPERVNAERFPGCEIVAGSWESVPESARRDGNLFIAVLNHHFLRDAESLAGALESRARYVGQIGPWERTRNLLEEVSKKNGGRKPDLACLHAPIGLDIGSETPREVALSILAEILAVRRGKRGSFLSRTGGGKS